MWFDGWSQVLRVVAVGAAAYLTLVLLLRWSGKRTLAKLNAFDLVVTVALGSTLARSFSTLTSPGRREQPRWLCLRCCSCWCRGRRSACPVADRW